MREREGREGGKGDTGRKSALIAYRRRYLVQFAAQLGQPVALLQGPGAGPLALLGQGAGELFVLRPLFLQLLCEPPLLFLQAADLASLKLQLRRARKARESLGFSSC